MMDFGKISKYEAARYMGIKGTPDGKVSELLDCLEPVVREAVKPCYVFRETTVEISNDGVQFGCIDVPFTGSSILEHIRGCERAVIFAATLSVEADKLIRKAAVTDTAEALVIDSLCSAAIEQVCDTAEEEIFSQIKARFRTWRFSPGYGDLPLSLQEEFLRALNAQRRIGLTVTENNLLVPSKSVTAVIGISERPMNKGDNGCTLCPMRQSCAYANAGRRCVRR